MKPAKSPRALTPKAEIAALIATMTEAERRLEELEVDTVLSPSGSPFVLRRAQEELRLSEADRQASILNSLPAHVALLDAEGVIVTVNETWRQFALANHFLGAECGVGVNYLTICDEARSGDSLEAPTVAQGIRTVLNGAGSFSLEYPCHSPTEQRWFQLTASPLSQAGGQGVVIMHVNVTGRKLAEQALRDSQTTMAAAQQIGHFGSWEVDLDRENDEDRNLLRWSDEMFHIAGYEPGAVEITNRFFFTLIPVEEHALIREAIAGAIRERKPYNLVHRLIRADGSVRFLQEQAKIFFDETGGRPVRIIGTAHDITERMQADLALRASEREQRQLAERLEIETARFSEAQAVANVGSWETDLATLAVVWSEETYRIFGTDPETFRPTHPAFLDLVHPADRALVEAAFTRSLAHTDPCTLEHRVRLPDGRIKHVEERWRVHRNANGKADRAFGICHDFTERRLAAETLRQTQDLLTMASTLTRSGAWSVKLPELTLSLSDGARQIHGMPPGATPTIEEATAFYAPECLDSISSAFAACVRDGNPFDLELQIITTAGQRVWVRSIGKADRDAAGVIQMLRGSIQDISQHKLAEIALRASEQRFKALFDQAAVGVAQSDVTTGRFVNVNQRFADITGRSRQELEQLTFGAITHPHDLERGLALAQELGAGTIREYAQEKRYVRPDGPPVWVSLTVSAMWAPGEKPGLCIAVVQDITSRKLMEEQVRQSQKMDAIGTLAGGIAHDFNNILAAIGGYTELARMTLTDNPGPRAHLGSVQQAVKRAADLVRQILTFSRQQPIERQAVELGPLVKETFGLLRATIPTTIEFELSLATDAPTVLADVTQVHQILMNLGTNAWHAMKNRPGRLEVRLERLEVDKTLAATQPRLHPGLYARVSVSDTGTGMDPVTLSRIFDPFFTTKAPGEGTGLGLAVAQGIMDTHDGVITVESTLAVGTVFHVYFPAHLGQVATTPAEISAIPHGRGERILVVDDEESIAQMMQLALITLGYEAEFATNPVAALDLVRADAPRFALVLTDLTMPDMTGLSLAARLRLIRPDLPIILMTGYSATLTPARVKAEGLQDLLLKPTSLPTLASAVHAALVPQPPV